MQPDHTYIGTIAKAHGTKGQLIIHLEEPIELTPFDYLFIKLGANLVPHRIEALHTEPAKLLVKLDNVDTRTAAYTLINQEAWIPTTAIAKTRKKKKVLTGYTVIDAHQGNLGPLMRIEEFPMHSCLVISYQKKELLIPYQKPLLIAINHQKKQIAVDLPPAFIAAQHNPSSLPNSKPLVHN